MCTKFHGTLFAQISQVSGHFWKQKAKFPLLFLDIRGIQWLLRNTCPINLFLCDLNAFFLYEVLQPLLRVWSARCGLLSRWSKAYAHICLGRWAALRFIAVHEVLAAHPMVLFDDKVRWKLPWCAPQISHPSILGELMEAQLLPHVLRGTSTDGAGAWHSAFEKYLNYSRWTRHGNLLEALGGLYKAVLTYLRDSTSCMCYVHTFLEFAEFRK